MMAGGWPVLAGLHGRTVTYEDRDTDPTEMTAVVGEVRTGPEVDDELGRERTQTRSVFIQQADLSYPAAAEAESKLTIDEDVWSITQVAEAPGGLWELHCELIQPAERSHRSFRTR